MDLRDDGSRAFLTAQVVHGSLRVMRSERVIPKLLHSTRAWRAATCVVGVTVFFPFLAQAAPSEEQASRQQARVPTSHAAVHEGPGSGSALFVLVPRDTVLSVIGRRGEWVQVELSPELRKTGIVIRWYEGKHELVRRGRRITIGDEKSGWMHDSTVEITDVDAR
jgi:hypothetical protein